MKRSIKALSIVSLVMVLIMMMPQAAVAQTPPSVSTNAATAVATTTATLNGNLTSLGTATAVNVLFEYGTTISYGSTTTAQAMMSAGTFNAAVSGLNPNTTYHFRAKADGGVHGVAAGSDMVFTTYTPPSVTTSGSSGVTASAAVLSGNLDSLGTASTVGVSFEYGTTTSYGNTTSAQAMIGTGAFNANLTGILPGTTYHFRAKADGGANGIAYGVDMTFTTLAPVVPSVTTNAATAITTTGATLNGNLTSLGTASTVNVSFEYGTTTAYGSSTATQTKTAAGFFSANLTSLNSNTTYHFRAKADGWMHGVAIGADMTFTTPSQALNLTLNPASGAPGTVITIAGSGFTTSAAGVVWFDTNGNGVFDAQGPQVETQVAVNTTATGAIPAGVNLSTPAVSAGVYQIRADMPFGGTVEASAGFTVITPSITLNPVRGFLGTVVTVTGNGFTANSTGVIWFDSIRNGILDSGETQIAVTTTATGAIPDGVTITVPVALPEQYAIRADIPTGNDVEAIAIFTIPLAQITLNPTNGNVGTALAISGTGFEVNTTGLVWFDVNGNFVLDGGEPQAAVTTTATGYIPTGITITVPVGVAAGSYNVRADIPFGGSIEATASFSVTPLLNLLNSSGTPGTAVTFSGMSFAANAAGVVWFDSNGDSVANGGEPQISVTTDNTGSFPNQSLTIPPVQAGTYNIRADIPAGGVVEASTAFNVTASAPTKIVFSTPARTINAGAVSPHIGIHTLDASNNPAGVITNTTISLTSTSGTGSFYSDTGGINQINSVTINAGSSGALFYYKDTTVGTPTITAASAGLTSCSQQETITAADTTSPTVLSTTPLNNAVDIPVGANITVTFSEAMNQASAQNAFSINPPAAGVFSWTGNVMTFNPNNDLFYATTYTVTIGTGAQDTAGNPLSSAYSFNFTSVTATQTTQPYLVTVSPNYADAPINAVIAVQFNKAMNQASTQFAFYINPAMTGTFSWTGNVMTFDPNTDLAASTKYTVTIGTGAQDQAGNPIAAEYTFSFYTVVSPPDLTPPTIIATYPANTATGVPAGSNIEITFSESMRQVSTQNTFSVAPAVVGTFNWIGNVMTFNPLADLSSGTTYTVTLGTPSDAYDLAGNPLASPYTFSFTTSGGAGPSITLTPNSGSAGTVVTITGNGFAASTAGVIFFDINSNSTLDAGETHVAVTTDASGALSVTLTVPAVSADVYQVRADIPAGGAIEYSATFTVTAPPTVPNLVLVPASGPAGTVIRIAGNNFNPGASGPIWFDTNGNGAVDAGEPSLNIQTNAIGAFSNVSIGVVPAVAVGNYQVRADIPAGGTVEASVIFNVTAAPSLALSPSSGIPGTVVTVSGSGFAPNAAGMVGFDGNANGLIDAGETLVTFTTTDAGAIPDGVTLTVPSVYAGNYGIRASTNGAVAAWVFFRVTSFLTISPISGVPGTVINVSGAGFPTNNVGVLWFDTNNNSIIDASEPQVAVTTDASGAIPTGVELTVPAGLSAGTYQVRADLPTGGTIEAYAGFQVTTAPSTNLDVYFSYAYNAQLSKADIQGTESFSVTIAASATCKSNLPLPVSESTMTGRVVAQHKLSNERVIINSSYSMSVLDLPDKTGQNIQETRIVPLQFPYGVASGEYFIIGELTLTRVKSLGIFMDVTQSLPSSYQLGSVNYSTLAAGTVNLSLQPPTSNLVVGQTFNLIVRAEAGARTVSGVQAFLNFDPTRLTVVDADATIAGVQIASGADLPQVLTNSVNNAAGTIDFSAGKLGVPFPSGTFIVATIQFRALAETASATEIVFSLTSPRKTMVDYGGTDITGVLGTATVTITADAPIVLAPPSISSVTAGQTFSLAIKTSVGAAQMVDGVDAFINFDPAKLEVVDADSAVAGIQIAPGSSLPSVLVNTVDNAAGKINYSAGKLGAPFPTGIFTVATIQFRVKAATASITSISFSFASPRKTIVDYGGAPLPGTHGDAMVQIIVGAPVNVHVLLQGDQRPDSGWVVPLTVKFFTPAANVLADTPAFTFNLTTAKSGSTATAQCMVAPGTYDVTAVTPHTLMNLKRNVSIVAGMILDMGTLFEGNANDNNIININDFGILALAYGKLSSEAGFDARADFDRNGAINISDFGLLAINYARTAPLELVRIMVSGTLNYNESPLYNFTSANPVLYARNNDTNELVLADRLTYDQATSKYTLSVYPGRYAIGAELDSDGNGWPLPGDFFPSAPLVVVPFGATEVKQDIRMLRILHLTSPGDNSQVLPHTDNPKPVHSQSGLAVRWDTLPEATFYELTIDRYSEQPYKFLEIVVYVNPVSGTEHIPQLPVSQQNEFYQLRIAAGRMVEYQKEQVGLLMVKYQNGYGWDYRFRVGP